MIAGRTLVLTMAGFATLWVSAPARAQDKDAPKAQPEIFRALTACRTITEDAARLACFDKASGALSTAVEQKEIVVLDKKEVQETRKGLFGFRLPKLPFFGGDDGDERGDDTTLTELETTIRSAKNIGYDKWRFVLADGAIWVTTDPIIDRDPEAGDPIRIKKAMFGSYNIFVDGGRPVKGTRQN